MRLEKWSVAFRHSGVWQPPEQEQSCLIGTVIDHPQKPNNTEVITSLITGLDGGCIRTESGSIYELGEVAPAYEHRYPHAKGRLLEFWRAPR